MSGARLVFVSVVGASLSEPHTNVMYVSLCIFICMCRTSVWATGEALVQYFGHGGLATRAAANKNGHRLRTSAIFAGENFQRQFK